MSWPKHWSPERREAHSRRLRAAYASGEIVVSASQRAKISASMRALASDPAERKRRRERTRAVYADPQKRGKQRSRAYEWISTRPVCESCGTRAMAKARLHEVIPGTFRCVDEARCARKAAQRQGITPIHRKPRLATIDTPWKQKVWRRRGCPMQTCKRCMRTDRDYRMYAINNNPECGYECRDFQACKARRERGAPATARAARTAAAQDRLAHALAQMPADQLYIGLSRLLRGTAFDSLRGTHGRREPSRQTEEGALNE